MTQSGLGLPVNSGNEGLARVAVTVFQVVFSALFPFMLLTSCAVSAVLAGAGFPQFGFLARLAREAVAYSGTHTWAALAIGVLALSALPLLWVAYREHAEPPSKIIGMWLGAAIYGAVGFWLGGVWPPTLFPSAEPYVLALFLFVTWGALCEAILGTVKTILANRPQPGREVVEAQMAHGHAQVAGEDEAAALLRK
jgi:hypothetical protein